MSAIMKMEIEILRYGQPKPYADSEYEYILTTEHMPEYHVKEYCTKVLRPCSQTYTEWNSNIRNAANYFHGYYKFEKLEQNKYRYFVLEPFCD